MRREPTCAGRPGSDCPSRIVFRRRCGVVDSCRWSETRWRLTRPGHLRVFPTVRHVPRGPVKKTVARGQTCALSYIAQRVRRGGQRNRRRDQQRELCNVSLPATVSPAPSRGRCLAGVTGPVTCHLVCPGAMFASCPLRVPFLALWCHRIFLDNETRDDTVETKEDVVWCHQLPGMVTPKLRPHVQCIFR